MVRHGAKGETRRHKEAEGGMIHADNKPIKFLSMQDQSRLYIGLLWSHRCTPRIRSIIRSHVRMIRKWDTSAS